MTGSDPMSESAFALVESGKLVDEDELQSLDENGSLEVNYDVEIEATRRAL
jgi:hypothetical protein